jgi:deferrochelatase/peroxidase EfeB
VELTVLDYKELKLMTTIAPPDVKNIQGFIMRGYTHPYSCHLLYSFTTPKVKTNPDTKTFFKTLYPQVQSAEDWGSNKPKMMLNIGLTCNGIQALNVFKDPTSITNFPSEFQAGPWSEDSQLSLGDQGDARSDPSLWWFGNFTNEDLHCVVHVYGLTQPDLDKLVSVVTKAAKTCGLRELFALKDKKTRLTQTQLPKDEIHFGYRDGISEPALDWNQGAGNETQEDLNNFLIGYDLDNSLIMPGPANPPPDEASSFARDGCYNAFRILYQDVAAFNTLLAQQAPQVAAIIGGTEEQAQEWVAAKLCGRWRNGSPLMLSPDKPDPATQDGEDFGYVDPKDPNKDIESGFKCPFSAHTRVANPRDQDLNPPDQTNFPPRIARRGMAYGPPLNSTKDDGADRGLIGIFLCGSPAQQFEKIYSWMNLNDFSPVFIPPNPVPPYASPQDTLLGNRNTQGGQAVTTFTIPMPDNPDGITFNLPDLLVTRGTAYCLLPSLTSLRQIAGL